MEREEDSETRKEAIGKVYRLDVFGPSKLPAFPQQEICKAARCKLVASDRVSADHSAAGRKRLLPAICTLQSATR